VTYAFNFTFTRADENHATTYEVGFNVEATNRIEAEQILRERNDHLAIKSIALFGVMNEDGDVLEGPLDALWYVTAPGSYESTLEDVVFRATWIELARQFAGGLDPREILAGYTTRAAANAAATAVFEVRDRRGLFEARALFPELPEADRVAELAAKRGAAR
jgi:hypothetical protein